MNWQNSIFAKGLAQKTQGREDAMKAESIYFLPFQTAVALDEPPLILVEKSRQIGMSYTVAYNYFNVHRTNE